jgi:hypothetical protein
MDIKNTTASLDKVGKLLADSLKDTLRQDDTYATGATDRSITHQAQLRRVKVVGSNAVFEIDEGRRPGAKRPSNYAIERWAKAKGLRPMYKGGIKNMVRIIANSIAEKGTIARFNYRGTNVLDRVIKENTNEVEEIVLDGFVADIQAYFDKLPDQITI